MSQEQKTVKAETAYELDKRINELLCDGGWQRSGDAHLVIKQKNYQSGSSDNEETWYQTLVRTKPNY
jgi:hypothetical protein